MEQLQCIFSAVISQQELEKSLYKVPDTLYKFIPLMLHLFDVVWSWTTLWSGLTDQISGAAIYTLFWYYCNPNSWVWNKIEKEGGQLKKNMALFLMDPLQADASSICSNWQTRRASLQPQNKDQGKIQTIVEMQW